MGIFILFLISLIKLGYSWEWEGEDSAKNLGVAAFGLFSLGLLYSFFFQIMRLILKLNKEKERNAKLKENYLKFFKIVRKPLLILHYLAGGIAIVLLSIHGIGMLPEDNEQAILGIITGSFLVFYVISGLLAKLKTPGLAKAKKFRKIMGIIHRSLILIIIILSIHVAHITM